MTKTMQIIVPDSISDPLWIFRRDLKSYIGILYVTLSKKYNE